MSKYKYEKEFMFSMRRLEEVDIFLQTEEQILDLPSIRDNNKNTVIHHTSYHNQPKILECYLRYYRRNLQRQDHSITEIKTKTRSLLDEPNAEGYTAAHYAAYRGNIPVIKLLEKYEASFGLTNHLKMTMLHLAAQGDKPSTFLYLHQKGLSINERDLKMTTPLHWASFVGAEKIVEYLLAQGQVEVNMVDSQGLTPLHLATTYGNSKIVKKLLIAGAGRGLRTNKGETALDIATKKEFQGIVRMLNDKYSLWDKLKIICNAKTRYEPVDKSSFYSWSFLVLWMVLTGLAFGAVELQTTLFTVLQGILLGSIIVLFASLVFRGKKRVAHPHSYPQYAESTRFYHLCMVCIREMRPREHHCPICKTCVHQYDHHCTWINTCVGKHNLARFNIMLICLELGLVWTAYLSVQIIVCLAASEEASDLFALREWVGSFPAPVYIAASVCLLIVLFFGIPLLCLIVVQMKNLLLGKTTYERFSRTNKSILTRESSLLMNQPESAPRFALKNCVVMCCEEDTGKKDGQFNSSTTSSFVHG